MSAGPRPTFRGDIEGLRAIAVLLVLVYHVGATFISGGFIGVDVFFVISGFLITSHLLKEIEATGTVRLVNFYARRARRLLPAATVVLLFTAAVGFLVLPRVHLANMASDVAAAAVYIVNWALAWRSVDYLAESAAVSPVQHYWSLSVEEQFYLVWPLLMLIVLALASRRHARFAITVAVLLLSAGSLVWSVHYTAVNPQMAFFVTTTRVWELGAGALLALGLPWLRLLPRLVSEGAAAVGLVAVAVAAFVIDASTPWPGAAAALPVTGTALVLLAGCAHPDTAVGRALGARPMRWVGGLSYSIYLWHWPLIIYAQHLWPDLPFAGTAAIGLLSIPLAWLSRRFVEDPIRFGARINRRPSRALAIGGAGMALSLAAAGAVYAAIPQTSTAPAAAPGALALVDEASPDARPSLIADPASVFTPSGPVTPDPLRAEEDLPAYYTDGCQAERTDTEPFLECVYGNPDAGTTVAVVGDSKAGQWLPAIELIAEQEEWRVEFYAKSACSFFPDLQYSECNTWNENALDHLVSRSDPPELVLVSQGTSTVEPEFAPAEPDEPVVEAMADYWSALEERGVRVIAIDDNPAPAPRELPGAPASVFECAAENPDDYSVCSVRRNPGHGTAALRAAAQRTGAGLVELNEWICPAQDWCPPVIGQVLVLRQGSHLTATYTETLAPLLHRELIELGVAHEDLLPLNRVDDNPAGAAR